MINAVFYRADIANARRIALTNSTRRMTLWWQSTAPALNDQLLGVWVSEVTVWHPARNSATMSLECCSCVCHTRLGHVLLEFGKRCHEIDEQPTIRIAGYLRLANYGDCNIMLA